MAELAGALYVFQSCTAEMSVELVQNEGDPDYYLVEAPSDPRGHLHADARSRLQEAMTRLATLAIGAWLLLGASLANAGGIPDPVDLLNRIIALEGDVRILQSDARLVPPRLDELAANHASLAERVEQDYDRAQETANRVATESARNDVQAGRLNGHDARLDLIPALVRCILPPLAYRHVTVRTRRGRR